MDRGSDSDNSDNQNQIITPIPIPKSHNILYPYNLVICGCYFSFVVLSGAIWNSYATLSIELATYYEVDPIFINLLAMFAFIIYVVGSIPISFVISRHGIRKSLLIAVLFQVIGTSIRAVGYSIYEFQAVGMFFNSIVPLFTLSMPSIIAAQWFPVPQRLPATSFLASSGTVGMAVGYILPVLFVPDPQNNIQEFRFYLFFQVGWALISFITIYLFIFDQSQYSTSRSRNDTTDTTATTKRSFDAMRHEMKHVLGLRDFKFLIVNYSMIVGILWSLPLQFSIILSDSPGISIEKVGLIGFLSTISGLFVLPVTPFIVRHTIYKESQSFFSFICFASILLIWLGSFLDSFVILIVSAIFLGFSCSCVYSLTSEFSIEITFPADETLFLSFFPLCANITSTIFITIASGLNSRENIYFFAALSLFGLISSLFVRPHFHRTTFHDRNDMTDPGTNPSSIPLPDYIKGEYAHSLS